MMQTKYPYMFVGFMIILSLLVWGMTALYESSPILWGGVMGVLFTIIIIIVSHGLMITHAYYMSKIRHADFAQNALENEKLIYQQNQNAHIMAKTLQQNTRTIAALQKPTTDNYQESIQHTGVIFDDNIPFIINEGGFDYDE